MPSGSSLNADDSGDVVAVSSSMISLLPLSSDGELSLFNDIK